MRDADARNPIQFFTPDTIVTATILDVADTKAIAFRIGTVTTYQLNGAGPVATLPAGSVTVVAQNVRTVTFGGEVHIELMTTRG